MVKQTRKFSGIDEAEVWVTKEIYSQFLKREDLRQTPEVHVSGICLKKEGDKYFVLLGKRLPARKLYPGLYEGCGGQLAANEIFTDGVKRHYLLEYGITVSVEKDIHTFYDINEAGSPLIPGISFLCEYVSGTPQSENHAPNPDWADENQFNKMEGYLVYSRSQRANRIFFTKYKERLQSRCS